jgi:hypothetical protein
MEWIKHLLEYFGGEIDTPPPGLRLTLNSLWWGVWWGVLVCAIMIFCGQSSKFIYIDF